MRLTKRRGVYDGPRCFIPFDHAGPDGKMLKGGWHYSTRMHRRFGEIPDRPLHLNDEDPGNLFYEYAGKHHLSWVEKHGVGNVVPLRALNGDHPPEAHSDHPGHAEFRKTEFRKTLGEAS